jgi:spore maturation protein CgeB
LGFIDGVNVMMYKDNNEMILKIKQLLSDDNLRESIGKSGLELSKKHTYEKRCETLINLYTTKI